MNLIVRLEYELAYYDSAVHRFNHYTMRTDRTIRLFCVINWTLIGGGALYRCSRCILLSQPTGKKVNKEIPTGGETHVRWLHRWQTDSQKRSLILVGRVFTNGPGDLGSIRGRVIPKTFKMILDTSLLTLTNIRHLSRVKWSRERSTTLPYISM